ncbi:MAG: patatin-like phospholipase family protein [SAR324 cluster bacterium]|nr:patatin-like phospholipase family protein [SAR324 cluster bacterium]
MAKRKSLKYALVLSGGGARGAYEAGVLYYLRTQLPKEIARSSLFQLYCGTSVGAINTAFMASSANDPLYQGAQIRNLWRILRDEDIYRTDVRALSGFLVKSGFFMATNFFGLQDFLSKQRNSTRTPFPFKSVLDTSPFVNFLRRNVAWAQIHRNIERGIIEAVTVSVTHMMSGQLVLFMERHPSAKFREGGIEPIICSLSPKHVLASAAIPLIFPIIRINRQFYGDGSLRQTTPMSPAIHLGANRILVVSTQYTQRVVSIPGTQPWQSDAEPTLGDVLGTMLDAIFIDKLDYDLEQMRRINYLIDDVEKEYGSNFLSLINTARRKQRKTNANVHALNKIIPFVIYPSQDIGALASEYFMRRLSRRESLTPMQKFFAKTLEGTPDRPNELMSFLLFDQDYLEALLQLGFEDARLEHERLIRFFSDQTLDEEESGTAV